MNTRICGLLLLFVASGACAEGMEERLRTQLRSTTAQLQALQSEQAQASAARIACIALIVSGSLGLKLLSPQ